MMATNAANIKAITGMMVTMAATMSAPMSPFSIGVSFSFRLNSSSSSFVYFFGFGRLNTVFTPQMAGDEVILLNFFPRRNNSTALVGGVLATGIEFTAFRRIDRGRNVAFKNA
jgi:hypothetical protein